MDLREAVVTGAVSALVYFGIKRLVQWCCSGEKQVWSDHIP